MNKLVVGLTGILGCGKSTVSQYLAQLGAAIIDMDKAGRWAVDCDADVQDQLRRTFGDAVFDQHGQLQRQKLGELVFSDAVLLSRLNAIVHPSMLKRVRSLVNKEKNERSRHYIVVDAALIFELNFDRECDLVVCVTAPLEMCLARALSKGLTEKQALERIRSQIPQQEKAARADYIIRNDASLEELEKRVRDVHDWLLMRQKE